MMFGSYAGGHEAAEGMRLVAGNASVALINTLTGAVAGVIVEVQAVVLRHYVRKAQRALRKAGKDGHAS
jgi:hypothetical protein